MEERFYGYCHLKENGKTLHHFRWFKDGIGNFTVGDIKIFCTLDKNKKWKVVDIVRKGEVFNHPFYEVHLSQIAD